MRAASSYFSKHSPEAWAAGEGLGLHHALSPPTCIYCDASPTLGRMDLNLTDDTSGKGLKALWGPCNTCTNAWSSLQ